MLSWSTLCWLMEQLWPKTGNASEFCFHNYNNMLLNFHSLLVLLHRFHSNITFLIRINWVWIIHFHSGRQHRGGLWIFGGQKELLRKIYLLDENKLAASFHVMWFISILILSLLRYPWMYNYPLVVILLRHIFSLTTEKYLMNG